jgi:hypothetical protein
LIIMAANDAAVLDRDKPPFERAIRHAAALPKTPTYSPPHSALTSSR